MPTCERASDREHGLRRHGSGCSRVHLRGHGEPCSRSGFRHARGRGRSFAGRAPRRRAVSTGAPRLADRYGVPVSPGRGRASSPRAVDGMRQARHSLVALRGGQVPTCDALSAAARFETYAVDQLGRTVLQSDRGGLPERGARRPRGALPGRRPRRRLAMPAVTYLQSLTKCVIPALSR